MSETMRPVSFACLMERALDEYRRAGSLFGVHRLYRHVSGKTLPIFREKLETPFGPAAGPHTQLAQNLLAAYAGGGRFFEVKTVQKMDGAELARCIPRPCILAADEGYNVEWSTELTVPQAYAEYVKAWYAMKLLAVELGLGAPDGFVINMSVGYDLEGIQTEKIDRYIEGMKNAQNSEVWAECRAWTLAHLDRFEKISAAYVESISPRVCDSITLSTLHGCPPEEIERIAAYLISEKGLNTYIKCNPTLLGYDFARKTLDGLGYQELVFDRHHFQNDLQYGDAVPMLHRLLKLAGEKGVEFGVKLTNTFPVEIAKHELPGEEMYMSGKSLYPLSISLAAKLEKDFDGKLRVSYSGGADAFSVGEIFACGVWPITLATTLLKPGGYNRLQQMAEELAKRPYGAFSGVDVARLEKLAAAARCDRRLARPVKPAHRPRAERKAPLMDCFLAGCRESCPIHQDIPAYLALVGEGRYQEALAVICEKNPLPFLTGTICNHRCQSACVRHFYEEPVHIRAMKLKAAQLGFEDYLNTVKPVPPVKDAPAVAVVGGGPGGMAAAFFAARAGARVTLFEKRDSLGGLARHVIPAFRVPDEAIENDARLLYAMGVDVRLNTEIRSESELRGFDHVIAAVGAEKHPTLHLEKGEAWNVLDFLEAAKNAPETLKLCGPVVVVGGGNSAMDAARALKRLPGVTDVTIAYRRQARQMPADPEEWELALSEGVGFRELLSPVSLEHGQLICEVMRLGQPGADGRRKPEPTGERTALPACAVVAAIGEQPDAEAISALGKNLRLIGDAKRGPATVVEAITDAAEAVNNLLGEKKAGETPTPSEALMNAAVYKARRGELRNPGVDGDSERCLGCSTVCESCVDVCPNRANVVVTVQGREQVLHVDRLCNECGNCAAFCPYSGEPFRDKLTLFSTEEDFDKSTGNQGFLPLGNGCYRLRLNGEAFESDLNDGRVDAAVAELIRQAVQTMPYLV